MPRSVRGARDFVRTLSLPVDDDTRAVLELLVSELVTNAVLHARTEAVVGVTVTDAVVLVAVGDSDEAQPTMRPHATSTQDGRGMQIVNRLALQWGVTRRLGGKTVWFTVARRGGAG